MMLVLSTILSPGPKAMQVFTFPLQVLDTKSHSSPVSIQMGPLVFGETSPGSTKRKHPRTRPKSSLKARHKEKILTNYRSGERSVVEMSFQLDGGVAHIIRTYETVGIIHGSGMDGEPVDRADWLVVG
jgi:hypothetical protein